MIPSQIVLNARETVLDGNPLRLTVVGRSMIIFAVRPVRSDGHTLTE